MPLFANLFFLILVFLLINSAPVDFTGLIFPESPLISFLAGLLLYACLLAIIAIQTRLFRLKKDLFVMLYQIEFVSFLTYFLYALYGQRLLFTSFMAPFGESLLTLFILSTYFCGLFTCQYLIEKRHWGATTAWSKALRAVRFLLPFAFPFITFTLLSDLIFLLPLDKLMSTFGITSEPTIQLLLVAALSVAILILIAIFLPPVLVWTWGCRPLQDAGLIARLNAICHKAHFKHAGFKIWTIMEDAMTAAIVGIVSRFRYVMFTQKLLDRLSPEAIESILAHEIGHSRHKHLLIYPFILFGMVLIGSLVSAFLYNPISEYLALHYVLSPSSLWLVPEPLIVLIPFILVIGLYFRFIFGYFSRIFERQADMHVFELNIHPEHIINSLNEVAIAAGNIHLAPNWHHYSIQKRMDSLREMQANPNLIARHHRKVRYSVTLYFAALALLLLVFLAPLYPETIIFKQINTEYEHLSKAFSDALNSSLRLKVNELYGS